MMNEPVPHRSEITDVELARDLIRQVIETRDPVTGGFAVTFHTDDPVHTIAALAEFASVLLVALAERNGRAPIEELDLITARLWDWIVDPEDEHPEEPGP
jgi:hypothetical protein